MKALDTNILIRRLVRDDPRQVPIADQEVRSGTALITHTVLMETEWVLRSIYKWPRGRISEALSELLRIETVVADDPDLFDWALARHAEGADLADMIHLGTAREAEEFVTFDAVLARRTLLDTIPVRLARAAP